jgi:hypothetical protein
MKTKLKYLLLSATGAIAIFLAVISGCGSDPVNPPTYIDNPNVKIFDSLGVDEDSVTTSYTGLDLLTGRTTISTDASRDCSLNDLNNAGVDFYLQNGELLNSPLPAGYEIRFFRVDANMSVQAYDTLSRIWGTGQDSLRAIDFTENGTSAWGYFNAPLSSTPVFCFWLKGRKDAGTTVKNVYGIIQPRESNDRDPFNVYGFRMSFRVRINTNGENDFRKQILSQ